MVEIFKSILLFNAMNSQEHSEILNFTNILLRTFVANYIFLIHRMPFQWPLLSVLGQILVAHKSLLAFSSTGLIWLGTGSDISGHDNVRHLSFANAFWRLQRHSMGHYIGRFDNSTLSTIPRHTKTSLILNLSDFKILEKSLILNIACCISQFFR